MIETKEIIDEINEHAEERNKVFEELQIEFPLQQFLEYNELDIHEKIPLITMKSMEYQDLLNKEQSILDKIMEQRARVCGDLYNHYRFEVDKKLDKFEIEKYYLPKEPKLLAFDKILRKQKWKVEYFTICVKALEKMSWGVKDFLKTCNR
jgi:hypothetical protein